MDKRRPVRNSALRAQQTFAANGNGPHASSDDDEVEVRPTTRTSRRGARVDFHKIDISSLQRYRKYYKLGDLSVPMSKEELIPVVQKHFNAQPVEEEEILLRFVQAVQNHNRQIKSEMQMQQQQQQRFQQQQQMHQQQHHHHYHQQQQHMPFNSNDDYPSMNQMQSGMMNNIYGMPGPMPVSYNNNSVGQLGYINGMGQYPPQYNPYSSSQQSSNGGGKGGNGSLNAKVAIMKNNNATARVGNSGRSRR
uniref:Histone deacetylase complex subunit SAP30 Sin3 binding domain-containing protein n=1 Tax=Polytomella parva TaxID=51329 RepID=A0A7S0VDT8_9CHLO|mmetsp:Transcript_33790/g.61012  ORF Transcript_33790/g.61012 Transcript_33790/m.61012 type:complete len:249 (+) Transcript_33790:247-993(+)|eukprot:CAMPEP_0175066762 /NCGR_PEP_ID=MMETSP0052_2-20121109/16701_1 /TAXON_ID=51329 ORGANISM="Polytomella parva, Strain SAG 63-3" /NCGR_SAMPLE_ID=MMETSP0052_2 /ASSEMBLY_ACC=CAM_ASM_000194 /LENGTH=248 /DNA_ID=CAMNT_0016333525 /DNA_START=44 /DNA_END=790 /DNA_ORIENTATION=-